MFFFFFDPNTMNGVVDTAGFLRAMVIARSGYNLRDDIYLFNGEQN